jgi:agmatinase
MGLYFEEQWRIVTYYDEKIRQRQFEGQNWSSIVNTIVDNLPQQVHISFDIDGLVPSLCPNTGTPVPGGLEWEQVIYLIKKVIESGRKLIGFDLVEVGVGDSAIDSNVGARLLWKLCNFLIKSNKG